MADNKLLTADTRDGATADPITGTSVGTKRGLDVHSVGSGAYFDLVSMVLSGQASLPNYTRVTVTTISSTQINYVFGNGASLVFTVSVTGTDTDTPVANYIVETDNLLLESGDALLQEDGDLILMEGA